MKLRFAILALLICALVLPENSRAHVGSPDVFFEGMAGPYPARVIVRMPGVVPGRATIDVEIENGAAANVFFRPLYFETAVSNSPPAEQGFLLSGTTNWYQGDLWLMAPGGYTIEVKIDGAKGTGSIQIPVNSIATQQLKMPKYLGALLVVLSLGLLLGGIAIVMTAAREAVLEPGELPNAAQSRKGKIAGIVTAAIFLFLLLLGNRWWHTEEGNFRLSLHAGGWPHLASSVRIKDGQPWLDLTVGKKKNLRFDDDDDDTLSLAPDHGKLAHLFLVSESSRTTFAHLHPVRTGRRTFSAALPPLPAGNYALFCDFTLEKLGISCTATDTITMPQLTSKESTTILTNLDKDDSWASYPPQTIPRATAGDAVYKFPDGTRVVWQAHPPLQANGDAGLRFEVWDATGKPATLQPYMEMLSHGVVMRSDGQVFVHLHPMGNYSMASQDFFQTKLARESRDASAALCGVPLGTNQSKIAATEIAKTVISLPYEFPALGDYRIWVQFKTGGKVYTAVFDGIVRGMTGGVN